MPELNRQTFSSKHFLKYNKCKHCKIFKYFLLVVNNHCRVYVFFQLRLGLNLKQNVFISNQIIIVSSKRKFVNRRKSLISSAHLYLTWNVSGSILAIDVNILNTALVTFSVAADKSDGPIPFAPKSSRNSMLYKTGITPNSSVF